MHHQTHRRGRRRSVVIRGGVAAVILSAAVVGAVLAGGGLAGAASTASACPGGTVDIGTYCLSQSLQTANGASTADYFTASRVCASQGGFLPSADELIGAANQVKLAGRLDDPSATSDQDPSDGLSDWREMSSTLVTTMSGSDAAGSEGISQQATGDQAKGEPNPAPQPADTAPASLQYVTVIDNGGHGGFAGSEPVSTPERFRCAFDAETPAYVPPATTTPSGAPNLTAKKSVSLATLGRRGIETAVSCPAACTYQVSLELSAKNARRLGLKIKSGVGTLATSSALPAQLSAGSEINVWLKPTSAMVSDLRYWMKRLRVASVAGKLVLTVQPTGAAKTSSAKPLKIMR